MTAPLTLTAYAARRGCSVKSVSIAVRDRRLVASVGRDEQNRPTILDPELADREWTANTRRRADVPAPGAIAKPPDPGGRNGETPTSRDTCDDGGAIANGLRSRGAADRPAAAPPYNVSRDVRAAADARKAVAAAGIAEIELEEKRGSVVPVAEVRAEVIERYSLVKTRLLAVPSAVGQRMPDIAVRVVAVVDELVREALEELSADGCDQ